QDIWEVLDQLVAKRKKKSKIDWKYVRGHTGVPGNERCDEISVGFTKGEKVILYSGSVLNYPFPIYDIPEDTSLPEMKPKKEKTAAYSYLSLVNGELKRHMTWKECEVAVKGRSGAKFKKAESQADEAKIVTSWGYRPDQIK
ncbi:MAG: viroplasmin family protein, partial [Bdellovibrionales bacterium]|nr:viroplasmin family protein [Bdellovibrionales bacterium]